jgi:microcystin-dependent protein
MGSDAFLGEINLFAGNFAPVGWAMCDGTILSISSNTALFSLLGTTYGGNGTTTFALPDMRGRAPVHFGQGPGLGSRPQGSMAGVESATLNAAQMPGHNHLIGCSGTPGTTNNPNGQMWSASSVGAKNYATPGNTGPLTTMAPGALASTGGGGPHNNMQPSLTLNYIIAVQGVYPSRP